MAALTLNSIRLCTLVFGLALALALQLEYFHVTRGGVSKSAPKPGRLTCHGVASQSGLTSARRESEDPGGLFLALALRRFRCSARPADVGIIEIEVPRDFHCVRILFAPKSSHPDLGSGDRENEIVHGCPRLQAS
jgi:hypothetical protein